MAERNEKYLVVKREDWERWADEEQLVAQRRCPPEVEDAVVIRRQDVFAPLAISAYSNAITVALGLIKEGVTSSTRAVKLRAIADYFREQSAMAWDADRKLPD